MNVAIAAHDLYPDPGSGGTGRYVYETATRLVDRGHSVTVLTRRRGDVPVCESVDGVDVRRYEFEVADRRAGEILRQVPGVLRAVRRRAGGLDPDVVSFQGPITGLLLDRLVDDEVPRSATFHSPWPTEYLLRTEGGSFGPVRRQLNGSLRRLLERRLLGRADDVIALSRFMTDQLHAVYGPVCDPTIVPGGVDVERYAPGATEETAVPVETDGGADGPNAAGGTAERDADGGGVEADVDGNAIEADANGTTFLTVRRLTPRMGHRLLLDAFTEHVRSHPADRLYVAGDGPIRPDLEAAARRLGVDDRVTFLGYVPDAALPATYASADVFVLPTTQLEGFGLATLEALSSGTPVIGTPVGGTVEILSDLERAEGYPAPAVAAAVDTAALGDSLREWTSLSADALDRAGRVSRRYARREYTWESTVEDLEARYRALSA